MKHDPTERLWEEGWEGHERSQESRMGRLPLWVRIDWLESAQKTVEHLRKSARTVESGPVEGEGA